jgi:hypothetical protein
MKRLLAVWGVILPSLFIVGCETDYRTGMISEAAGMIDICAAKVDTIREKVAAAVAVSESKKTMIDLSDAIEALSALKEAGKEAQKLKKTVDLVRHEVSEDDRKRYAEKERVMLSNACQNFLTKRNELNKELERAESINKENRVPVAEFRRKLVAAESEFEAIARQQ